MVIRAKVLGYCMGVRRAVDLSLTALKKYPNHVIYTLGPLIHNKTAIEMLKEKGITILEKNAISSLYKNEQPSVVILSAHGTSHHIHKEIEQTGAVIVDATCPRVLINQKRITEYAQKGYTVFITGDKAHGEVIALEGSCPSENTCYVIQNAEEAKAFLKDSNVKIDKAILVSQTTITQAEYHKVSSVLQSAIENIIVFDTICPATLERQEALREIHKEVDGIVVIGGKNSANTERLYQIAVEASEQDEKNTGKKIVCYIENASEIPTDFFSLNSVGLTAGASTPDDVIIEVENALLRYRSGDASE